MRSKVVTMQAEQIITLLKKSKTQLLAALETDRRAGWVRIGEGGNKNLAGWK